EKLVVIAAQKRKRARACCRARGEADAAEERDIAADVGLVERPIAAVSDPVGCMPAVTRQGDRLFRADRDVAADLDRAVDCAADAQIVATVSDRDGAGIAVA